MNRGPSRHVLTEHPLQPIPFTPANQPSYRIYGPAELQHLTPATFRGAPAPQGRGWFSAGLVMLVVGFVGGGSFAALRAFDVDLPSARTSLLTTTAAAPAAAPVVALPAAAAPASVTPAFVPAEASGLTSANARRKARGPRHNPPAIVNIPRGGVVAKPVLAPASKPASAVPPNPF